MKSILALGQISSLTIQLKSDNKKIVVVGGCFDILHPGHVTFLKKAKALGEVLMVFLESDERVKRMKGEGRPINPQRDRAEVLAALKSVDYVIMLPEEFYSQDYDSLVSKIKPDIIAITSGDPKVIHKQRSAALAGAKVKSVCYLFGDYSSKKIIEKIRRTN